MSGVNDPIIDYDAREVTITVLEKKGGLYAACIGNPQKDKPRNWGHARYWGDEKWDDSVECETLWRRVRAAVRNDDRYGLAWKVRFKHRFTEDRRKQLGWSTQQCDDRAAWYDREANSLS